MIHQYVCIVCNFIIHTSKPWQMPVMECPSCHSKVETRTFVDDDEEAVKVGEVLLITPKEQMN